jgi:hypothetical protein
MSIRKATQRVEGCKMRFLLNGDKEMKRVDFMKIIPSNCIPNLSKSSICFECKSKNLEICWFENEKTLWVKCVSCGDLERIW